MTNAQVTRTQLGVAERGSVWRSTLNGAEYRWADDGWQVRFPAAPEWHALRSARRFGSLFSYAGEKFVEVSE